MEITINPRPMSVNSAENALKKSITSFYLLDFNYPSEAIDCIAQLWLAMEMLLRELYTQEEIGIEEWNAYTMIQFNGKWNSKEKDTAHWLREKRNDIQHRGEAQWEAVKNVRDELFNVYKLVGKTYQDLGYKLDEVFTIGEQKILGRGEIDWKEEARILAKSTFKYMADDPELAISIANSAFIKAFRGFAKCCRVKGSETLSFSELLNAVENNQYWFEAEVPVSWDEWQFDAYYWDPINVEDPYHVITEDKLISNQKVLEAAISWGYEYGFRILLEENMRRVNSIIDTAPELDYFESVANNWNKIITKFEDKYPELKIPGLKKDPKPERLYMESEFGIAAYWAWWEWSKGIVIHFEDDVNKCGWKDIHKESLREIITQVCGHKPMGINITISPTIPESTQSDEADNLLAQMLNDLE